MSGLNELLAILDRESVAASNPADMRRVMSQTACELRAAGQRRVSRGEVVRYDGVGLVETGRGRVAGEEIDAHMARRICEARSTLRAWGVEVVS